MKMNPPSERVYTILVPLSLLVSNSPLIGEPVVLDFLVHEFNPTALDHGVRDNPEEAGKPGGCHLVDVDDLIAELKQVFCSAAFSPIEVEHPVDKNERHEEALDTRLGYYDDGEPFEMPGYDGQHHFRIYTLTLVRQHTVDVVDDEQYESIEYRVHRDTTLKIEDIGFPAPWASALVDACPFESELEDEQF